MTRLLRVMLFGILAAGARTACAIEVKISAGALERTLQTQLFNSPEGRYYMKGDATTPCYVYAESPHVSFKGDRVIVHVHTRAKLGEPIHGACVGVTLTTDADVSFVPDAEGEAI